jgi:hypothetical protein
MVDGQGGAQGKFEEGSPDVAEVRPEAFCGCVLTLKDPFYEGKSGASDVQEITIRR